MKKRFPFEFKTIDFYKNNQQFCQQKKNWPHWKEIETIQSQENIIRFYPLRFKDGLIERKECIGERTIEKYEGRDDNLIYCQVDFKRKKPDKKKDLYTFVDRNVGPVYITKMVQQFDKNGVQNAND